MKRSLRRPVSLLASTAQQSSSEPFRKSKLRKSEKEEREVNFSFRLSIGPTPIDEQTRSSNDNNLANEINTEIITALQLPKKGLDTFRTTPHHSPVNPVKLLSPR